MEQEEGWNESDRINSAQIDPSDPEGLEILKSLGVPIKSIEAARRSFHNNDGGNLLKGKLQRGIDLWKCDQISRGDQFLNKKSGYSSSPKE
mmetsp:Transcript_3454/g.4489  ORF Transcript_3454/g.4489 Transcript_3454/m.4489 type:complete len:91 (+) Transcript_3454:92-364(+)